MFEHMHKSVIIIHKISCITLEKSKLMLFNLPIRQHFILTWLGGAAGAVEGPPDETLLYTCLSICINQ